MDIAALDAVVFGEGDPAFEKRTLAQWRWLWAENPMGRQIMVAVTPSGQVIAHYGALPARLQVHRREKDAYYVLPLDSAIPGRLERLAERAAATLRASASGWRSNPCP